MLTARSNAEKSSECRICRGIQGRNFSANGFRWLRCDFCGSVQKVITHEDYVKLQVTYDPGVYLESADRDQIEHFLRVGEAEEVLTRALAMKQTVGGSDLAKPTFLDVGCGMGAYLLAADKLGYEVMGFEPSASHAHVATKVLKLPVVPDYFSPELVGAKRFDLIMLSHVIEHIYSPKEFLHSLISVLKPGGILIVITPNSDSIVAKITGSLWPMLKPPDHVSMLSAKTYSFFGLESLAKVTHRYSEFPYEFAATAAAVIKWKVGRSKNPSGGLNGSETESAPPPLRRVNAQTLMIKVLLTMVSGPVWLIALMTGKRACLNSVLVRKSSTGPILLM